MFRYVVYFIGIAALAVVLWPAILRGIKAVKKASATTVPDNGKTHSHDDPPEPPIPPVV